MKVIHGTRELTVKQGVEYKLTPNPYSYDGQLEKLEKKIELLQEVVAELVSQLASKPVLYKNDLAAILGYSYEVEE